jgi:SET domain-containing protein
MQEFIKSPDVYVKDTGTEKGKGVFAARAFSKGELVELSSVIIIDSPFSDIHPILKRTVYSWGALTKTGQSCGLVLGFGSLYNHANPANMSYTADVNSETMSYIAVRDIEEGEELSVNYSSRQGEPQSDRDLWFINRRVDPI